MWHRGQKQGMLTSDNAAAAASFASGDEHLQKREACESIPYFRTAVAQDGKFARAYASLATAVAMCGDPNDEADGLVAVALALNPQLSEAHAADGFLKLFRNWDWDGAEAALRRSVALDPSSAKSHHWLGVCLSIRGRLLEAAGEMKRAIEIDPSSPLYHADLCQLHYFYTDHARAIGECQRALDLDPTFVFTPKYLREIYLQSGDEVKAMEFEARYQTIMGTPSEIIEKNNELWRREGYQGLVKARIRGALDRVEHQNPNEQSRTSTFLAENFAYLRDRENTLLWLGRALSAEKRDRLFSTAYLGVDPLYTFLRDDLRFKALLQKMDLGN
jgi:tetratricopeptide (TPR) repeat protein